MVSDPRRDETVLVQKCTGCKVYVGGNKGKDTNVSWLDIGGRAQVTGEGMARRRLHGPLNQARPNSLAFTETCRRLLRYVDRSK